MLIYGANGYTKLIIDAIVSSKAALGGIFEDEQVHSYFNKYTVLGKYDPSINRGEEILLSYEDNMVRKIKSEIVAHIPGRIIHNTASVTMDIYLGAGSLILSKASVLTDVKIGKYAIVNSGALIDHDCILHDFSHAAQGSVICNNVIMGVGSHAGPSATIMPGVRIGDWATICAGAVVINDVPDCAVIAGNPGKIIKYKEMKYFKNKVTGSVSSR